jgi:hypothetical protein
MVATGVLEEPETPLPEGPVEFSRTPRWGDLFAVRRPNEEISVVLIWSTWSAHSRDALRDFQRAADHFREFSPTMGFYTAVDVASRRTDVARQLRQQPMNVPEIGFAPRAFLATEAVNQIPATLLFRHGIQVDRRLGAQTFSELMEWLEAVREASVDLR